MEVPQISITFDSSSNFEILDILMLIFTIITVGVALTFSWLAITQTTKSTQLGIIGQLQAEEFELLNHWRTEDYLNRIFDESAGQYDYSAPNLTLSDVRGQAWEQIHILYSDILLSNDFDPNESIVPPLNWNSVIELDGYFFSYQGEQKLSKNTHSPKSRVRACYSHIEAILQHTEFAYTTKSLMGKKILDLKKPPLKNYVNYVYVLAGHPLFLNAIFYWHKSGYGSKEFMGFVRKAVIKTSGTRLSAFAIFPWILRDDFEENFDNEAYYCLTTEKVTNDLADKCRKELVKRWELQSTSEANPLSELWYADLLKLHCDSQTKDLKKP